MRSFTSLACLSLITLLSACGSPSDGYYDANGNYIPYNRYNREAHDHAPLPGGTNNYESRRDYYDNHPDGYSTTTVYHYDRAGYYDDNGYYTTMNGMRAPRKMLPMRGMCRVWFPDRDMDDQPDVESCTNIQSRVPAGAYVIYGG